MRLSVLGIAALAASISVAFAQGDAQKPDPSHITFTMPKDIAWKTSESMDQAVIFGDPAKASAAAPFIAKRMNVLAEETERGWEGSFNEETGFIFTRTVRGVQSVAIIDHALLGSADARKLDEYAVSLQKVYEKPGALRRKDDTWPIHGPVGLFEAITGAGRKGVSMQRYKGLGEMNPEQLWETTLDVNARSLLQVRIKEVDEANVLFDQLMGDLVEPRRQFIQDNALAASVDV